MEPERIVEYAYYFVSKYFVTVGNERHYVYFTSNWVTF